MKKKESDSVQTGVDDETGTGRERRRLLKTLVAGGGVLAAGKSLPETWTKPMVEAIVLPSHAQTSPQFLSCRVATVSSLNTEEVANPLIDEPLGPFTGGSTGNLRWSDDNNDPYTARLSGISAEIDTSTAGVPITLNLITQPQLSVDAGGGDTVNTNGSGQAFFNDIDVSIPGNDLGGDNCTNPGGDFGGLTLTFSAPDFEDCVIGFTFSEFSDSPVDCELPEGP